MRSFSIPRYRVANYSSDSPTSFTRDFRPVALINPRWTCSTVIWSLECVCLTSSDCLRFKRSVERYWVIFGREYSLDSTTLWNFKDHRLVGPSCVSWVYLLYIFGKHCVFEKIIYICNLYFSFCSVDSFIGKYRQIFVILPLQNIR